MRGLLAVTAILVGIAVAGAIAGTSRWNRDTADMVAQLGPTGAASPYHEAVLVDQPLPVQRYFRKVLKDGQQIVRSAIATQDAEFFINGGWRPLRATQHFRTASPAFVWDASIAMAPLMPAFVRDSYVDGRGSMRASLYGIWTIVDQAGMTQLNLGALQRYLGEAVWFPTALLPSSTLTWQPRDDHSALATLYDRGSSVVLLFEFDEAGMVKTVTGDRFKETNGTYTLQRWEVACSEPALRGGMLIPLKCEVSWLDNGTRQPYWRGRVATINHEFWP